MEATTPHQGSLSLQQMETIKKKHIWVQCRDQQIMGNPVPNNTSTSQFQHLSEGASQKMRQKDCKSQDTRKCAVRQSLEMAALQD